MSNPEIANLRARMTECFQRACKSLGITAAEVVIGHKSHAIFLSAGDAEEFASAVRLAGGEVDVYHWDPAKDPDLDRHEWQVCW